MKLAFVFGLTTGAVGAFMGVLVWLASEILVQPKHRDVRSMRLPRGA